MAVEWYKEPNRHSYKPSQNRDDLLNIRKDDRNNASYGHEGGGEDEILPIRELLLLKYDVEEMLSEGVVIHWEGYEYTDHNGKDGDDDGIVSVCTI